MKDRFKFRGKRIDNNQWVYGGLVLDSNNNDASIVDYANHEEDSYTWNNVDIKTVGQCTGLKDKNGKLIYEGDILETPFEINDYDDGSTDGTYRGLVHFRPSVGYMQKNALVKMDDDYEDKWKKRPDLHKIVQCYTIIIGNIHENPELLNEHEK